MGKIAAIVLAAGVGKRMNSEISKQYMLVHNKPILYYSLKAFENSAVDEIILVTGQDDISYCRMQIVEKYHINKVKKIIAGGKERYHSVYNGLQETTDTDIILIHDAARPMIDRNLIQASIDCVKTEEACVLGVPVKDTIKTVGEGGYVTATPDRNSLWSIQTPQTFRGGLIREAYNKLYHIIEDDEVQVPQITDDAMVVEYATGKRVKIIHGKYENIKITTPEDLRLAELFLES